MVSQPCSAVELVLFDAEGLSTAEMRSGLASAIRLGFSVGALTNGADILPLVTKAGVESQFGFWLAGEGSWPFERATAFASVEPGRVLFVSDCPEARRLAEGVGMQAFDPSDGDLDQRLP